MSLKILICGSRDWTDRITIANVLGDYILQDVVIIHGAASRKVYGIEQSADMLADEVARIYGYEVRRFPANWELHGRYAGPKRNLEMLDQKPDLVIAFQKGKSRGTQHTIDNARARGIDVKVWTEDGQRTGTEPAQ